MAQAAGMNINWKAGGPIGWKRGKPIETRTLHRLAMWGTAAAAALMVAVLTAHFGAGSQRAAAAAASTSNEVTPWPAATLIAQLTARADDAENETKRVSEAVYAMAQDRERLIARIASLEKNLEDVTGSIKRPAAAAPATSPPAPSTAAAITSLLAPAPLASRDQVTPNRDPADAAPAKPTAVAPAATEPPPAKRVANFPLPTPASGPTSLAPPSLAPVAAEPADADPVKTKLELGVDIGGATNFDGLRTLWHSVRAIDTELFQDLHPLVVARESKTRATDLRLIAGPLPNLDAATRLCVALSTERRYCQPTAFEGQELALSVPEHKPSAAPQRKSTSAASSVRASSGSRPKS